MPGLFHEARENLTYSSFDLLIFPYLLWFSQTYQCDQQAAKGFAETAGVELAVRSAVGRQSLTIFGLTITQLHRLGAIHARSMGIGRTIQSGSTK